MAGSGRSGPGSRSWPQPTGPWARHRAARSGRPASGLRADADPDGDAVDSRAVGATQVMGSDGDVPFVAIVVGGSSDHRPSQSSSDSHHAERPTGTRCPWTRCSSVRSRGDRGLSSARHRPACSGSGRTASRRRSRVAHCTPSSVSTRTRCSRCSLVAGIGSLYRSRRSAPAYCCCCSPGSTRCSVCARGKAEAAVAALQKMMIVTARVRRDGASRSCPRRSWFRRHRRDRGRRHRPGPTAGCLRAATPKVAVGSHRGEPSGVEDCGGGTGGHPLGDRSAWSP